jgi:elongator complex protein 3
MFRALNDFGIKSEPENGFEPKGEEVRNKEKLWNALFEEHKRNETAKTRSVGLSIETRPDFLDEEEVVRLRKMGCTKIQIGVQSMDDKVLELNKRGHDAKASIDAANILRQAGFKIQIHYMPNLYGSSPEIDVAGYEKLFETDSVMPDELKLYPTSIIKNTELFDLFEAGEYEPYDEKTLLDVMVRSLRYTPEYTRLTRVIRDIPSPDIVAGNKKTNFREIVEKELNAQGTPCQCIRCREIKNTDFDPEKISLKIEEYDTQVSHELFLQYVTNENKILGFLRLSFPKDKNSHFIKELERNAIIREIHVYGTSLNIHDKKTSAPQHLGLGTRLIKDASKIAKENGFERLAVISAIGTKEYYRKKGFSDGELYQYLDL